MGSSSEKPQAFSYLRTSSTASVGKDKDPFNDAAVR